MPSASLVLPFSDSAAPWMCLKMKIGSNFNDRLRIAEILVTAYSIVLLPDLSAQSSYELVGTLVLLCSLDLPLTLT